MGLRALREIQIGEESEKGTAVAATAVLLGALTMKESPVIHRPVEERGTLAEFSRSLKVANLAELTFEGDVTFEQILYLLHMGMLGNVSPTNASGTAWASETAKSLGDIVVPTSPNGYQYKCTTAGTTDVSEPSPWGTTMGGTTADGSVVWTCCAGKLWTFTPSMAAAGVFDSFTIEYGDDVQAWETEYCLVKGIEVSGAMNEPMRVRGDIFGRKMTATTFTPDLNPPSVISVPTQKAKLYIDDEDGTIGSTEKSATLIAFTFSIATGLAPKRYADGAIDFSAYAEAFKGVELSMTFAFNSGAEVERLKFDGETFRLIRIEAIGALLRKLTLDFCGIYTDWATLSEREGEDIVEVTMSSQRGANYTKLFEVTVVNDVTTLP